jgi:ACT domain-containing protein
MNIRINNKISVEETSTSCLDLKIQATDLAIKEIENELESINNVLCALRVIKETSIEERTKALKQVIEYLHTNSFN